MPPLLNLNHLDLHLYSRFPSLSRQPAFFFYSSSAPSAIMTLSTLVALLGLALPLTALSPPVHRDLSPAAVTYPAGYGGPVFTPSGPHGSHFKCDYSRMAGWKACNTAEDRSCWLKNDDGERFDIQTDYEAISPQGVLRRYTFEITDDWVNADGLNFTEAKLFNGEYPGPWIQACWGDTVEIKVKNRLHYNGTSVHWHGIRQLETTEMDGVNGVTQCALAPGEEMVYRWHVAQYGSSWYHSHYSVQYADGAAGPMTLHGPSSASYDEAPFLPLILTDWGHNSAFEAIYSGLDQPSLLINGRGNITRFLGGQNDSLIPEPHTLTFARPVAGKKPTRYLLYLINASFKVTLKFSMDNHNLTIVGNDFVPIHPYSNTSITLGIGQRFHVIVEANPIDDTDSANPIPAEWNFWMRTTIVSTCEPQPNALPESELVGVVRYADAACQEPTSLPWSGIHGALCLDDSFTNVATPILPWLIGPAANDGEARNIILNKTAGTEIFPLALWSLEDLKMTNPNFIPMRINYGDPTILHLNNTSGDWNPEWIIVPEDYTNTDWVYIAIQGGRHPMHLHGHDFAIVQAEFNTTYSASALKPNLVNPPRRDTIIIPQLGFVVIAFRSDNPGTWLLHCHIAFHAAGGLAMQILERQPEASELRPWDSPAIQDSLQVCNSWNGWWDNCNNWWPGDGSRCPEFNFQDDSGI